MPRVDEANVLLVTSGLPGVGKTAAAAAVAKRTASVHLSIDTIEEALLESGLPPGWTVGVAAYEAARAMAQTNLMAGSSVVVDAVNDSDEARRTWRRAAGRCEVPLRFVHLICSDVSEHRVRLQGRTRGFQRIGEPSWADVIARAADFVPWSASDEVSEVDTAGVTLATVVEAVLAARDGS